MGCNIIIYADASLFVSFVLIRDICVVFYIIAPLFFEIRTFFPPSILYPTREGLPDFGSLSAMLEICIGAAKDTICPFVPPLRAF